VASTVARVADQRDESVPEGLRITQRHGNGAVIVAVAGEVDLVTAPALADAVHDALSETGAGMCVVDLTEVTFLASAGPAALLEAASHAERRREPLLIVVDSNRPVIRPLQVTGLDHVLALYHTVEEALAAYSGAAGV
jgi:anti-sigma B factor antagonist